MANVIWDSSRKRWLLKRREEYQGQCFWVTGSSTKSKSEARQRYQASLARAKARIDGDQARCKGKTVSASLWEWYDLYRRHDGRKGKTVITDEVTLRQIEAGLGGVRVKDLTPEVVQGYLLSIRSKSTSTLKKVWGMLIPYLRHLGRDDIISRIARPASSQAPPEKRAFTDSEILALSAVLRKPYDPSVHTGARGYYHGAALVVCMFLFLRVGELVELRAGDVQGDFITVKRQYAETEHAVRSPKYGSSRRVPVMAEVRDLVQAAAEGKEPGELLFPSLRGTHLSERDLLRTLDSACEIAGVPRHTIHDLRHDGISRLVRRGVSVAAVSRWAGHRSVETTLRRYFRDDGKDDERDLQLVQVTVPPRRSK